MFIKILTPNHNGKIELTVRDLEALIQEAVDKAVREDRANRPYYYYGLNSINGTANGIQLKDGNTETKPWWTTVTCEELNINSASTSGINTALEYKGPLNGDSLNKIIG